LRGYCNTYNHDGEFALIGRQGALCGNMNFSCGKAYFTEHAVAVKANSSSNTRFLYYLLDKMNLGQYSDQSAQPGLAVGKLVKLENMFPSKAEQDKIGSFLVTLDNLITLHQRKPLFFRYIFKTWEQRKLGECGETFTGLSGKTKEDFGHGDARFVTYMNVFSNPIADKDKVEAVEIDQSQNCVKYGDVFFTTSSETPEEVGMSCVWLENTENTYLNSFCFGYRPSINIDPYFMAYVLRSETVRKKIVFLAQGISRYNISKNKVMEIEIPLPSIDEQKRLGSYFTNLDNLITLHRRVPMKC